MTTEITDDYMKQMLGKSRLFTALLLRMTEKYDLNAGPESEQRKIIWQHGKRNFELRASGVMPLVGPLTKPPYAGLAIFTVSPEETQRIMEDDPAVRAGLFSFEVMPWRSFPGDTLIEPAFEP
jgi:YCII-related domain